MLDCMHFQPGLSFRQRDRELVRLAEHDRSKCLHDCGEVRAGVGQLIEQTALVVLASPRAIQERREALPSVCTVTPIERVNNR